MSGEHSILSPSSAHRRVRCLGSLAACKGIPNPGSRFAAEGTAYHALASMSLEMRRDCAEWVGWSALVRANGFVEFDPSTVAKFMGLDEYCFTITEENAAHAQAYVDRVRAIPGDLNVEVRLDTSPVVGVEGQGGTGDAVILDYGHDTIHVHDLKFGMGEVVYAKDNEQLIEYGAAAWLEYGLLADWKFIKIAIDQPRVRHYDEYVYAVAEIRRWIEVHRPLEQEAYRLWKEGTPAEIRAAMKPSPKACRWCPLQGNCPARTEGMAAQFSVVAVPAVAEAALRMTDEQLNDARLLVDDMEKFISGVKQEAHARAMQGAQFKDWELVEGKKGNRAWLDAKAAEATLVAAVGPEAYEPQVIISPSEADKLLNKKRHPEAAKRQAAWADLVSDIHQAPAGKSLVRRGTPNKTPATVQRLEFTVGGGE